MSLRSATGDLDRREKRRTSRLETIEIAAHSHNGVPRSGSFRGRARAAAWYRPYGFALVALDWAAAAGASTTAISLYAQAESGFQHSPTLFRWVAYVWLPLTWLVVLWAHGAYDHRYLGLGTDEYKRVFRSGITITAIVSFAAFATKTDLSRLSVGTALLTGVIYVTIGRGLARQAILLLRRHGMAQHRVLLLGRYSDAMDVFKAVRRAPRAGLVPVGVLVTSNYAESRGQESPVPVFTGRDVLSVIRDLGADMIAVCGPTDSGSGELRRLAWQLEGTGIDLVVAPQLTDIAGPRVHVRPVEGLPLLQVEEPKLSGFAWLIKNLMDRVLSALALIILAPVLAIIAICIRISDGGPAIFRQDRMGRAGERITMYKFRTMYVDAEERLAEVASLNEADGMLFKIRNDPRITPIGRFLRRHSLDELPQFLNVLKGDMSLVGPRPLPADDGDFMGDVRRRLLVPPGITGLWQVSGRSDLSWDDTVRLDLYYVDNWSLTLDLVIIWRTLGVFFRRRGAY